MMNTIIVTNTVVKMPTMLNLTGTVKVGNRTAKFTLAGTISSNGIVKASFISGANGTATGRVK